MKQLLLLMLSACCVFIGCEAQHEKYLEPGAVGRWESNNYAYDRAAESTGKTSEGGFQDYWLAPSAAAPQASNEAEKYGFYSLGDVNGRSPQNTNKRPPHRPLDAVAASDEVWIIATPPKPEQPDEDSLDDDAPGSGSLMAVLPPPPRDKPSDEPVDAEPTPVAVPLEHTEVDARVDAYIASVNVKQRFHNPYDTKIEAVYVFPLPQDAAVSEFVMTIGDRTIRGILRERQEAERLYREARAAGHNASLLTQERPNIFTQKVANIEPGKRIDIDITYFQALAYSDGVYSFVFPMVVGPRFNPPHTEDPIHAVARPGRPGDQGPTSVAYLRPTERSGHDIGLTLTLAPGVPIETSGSVNHHVHLQDNQDGSLTVQLDETDSIPNKDFVFAYRVAGDAIRSNLLTHHDPETGEGYFTMTLYPPADLASLSRQPMEMVFVLDCSGSMSGEPIAQAKAAMLAALDRLEPDDTFQIIRFSSNASQLGNRPLPATAKNLRKARRYVQQLSGSGGTMMIEGVKAALDFEHDPRRYRVVTFMTDGYIGNEREILGAVYERLGAARVFSFGVGSSTNRYLLHGMARAGRGAAAFLSLNDDASTIMDLYFDRISHPAMTDVAIDFGDTAVSDVYPSQLPDLFVGRPVVVTGRYAGAFDTVRVGGRAGPQDLAVTVEAPPQAESNHPALAKVWARQRIADLNHRMAWEQDPDLVADIRDTALRHGLMSAYTAFIAVDASRITEGDHGVSVAVPVPVPDGVRYDTTVTE